MQVHAAPWLVPIASPPLRDGAVALDGMGVVRAVGPRRELSSLGEIIDHDGIVLPGLINAHAHLELSYLGLVPGGEGLAAWIRRLLAIRSESFDPSLESEAAKQAARRLAERGTVAVADISNDGRVLPHLRAAEVELLDLHEFVAPGPLPPPARPGAVATPHSTYTVGVPALEHLARVAGGRIRSIHVEEDPGESAYLVEGAGPIAQLLADRHLHPQGTPSGKRPVEHLDALGLVGRNTLLVHLTFARPQTLALAAERSAVAVLCPRSNLHITGKLPPFEEVRAARLTTALGTDSLASSPSLDVLGEVQTLARAGANPEWLLRAATLGGADALELPHRGALAVGRRPGLVHVATDAPVDEPLAWLAHEAADAPIERLHS